METTVEKKVGLFRVSYQIGEEMPGAPLLTLNLGVYTPEEKITGIVHITQATNPPLEFASNFDGHFTYMCTMKDCHILVTGEGYPMIKWPKGGGIGPVILPNFQLHMVLTEDWKSGTANYKYQDKDGKWHQVTNQPVKIAEVNEIHQN